MRKIYRVLTAAVLVLFVFCAVQGFAQESAADPLEEKIAWIVDTYTDSGVSEYEIVLALHDWICENVQYDYQAIETGVPSSPHGLGVEAAIMDGWAVCSGYAATYDVLLEKAGIEAKSVTGYDHAWSIVKIDGDWYHFDLTWDDGSGSSYDYDYFGLCDAAIHAEPVNHGTQDNYRHVTCDSWAANYHYRNGKLDAALAALRSAINARIAAGTYTGTITLANSDIPEGQYSNYTIALILGKDSDWAVSGRVEVTPESASVYSFVFYPDEEPVQEIRIDGLAEDLTAGYYGMYPGYTAQINVTTIPAGRTVSFASSNESVVTVSQDGLVTAVGIGGAFITLKSGNYIREYSVWAYEASWLMDEFFCYLDIGEKKPCRLNPIYNWFLKDMNCRWSSADEKIAAIDQNGVITGVAYGQTTVTLENAYGEAGSMTVYVRKPVTAVVFAKSVYEVREDAQLSVSLHAEGCDQDFYMENISYFDLVSSDETVVRPGENYSITWNSKKRCWVYTTDMEIIGPGEATLTATAADGSGASGSCTIIVKETPKLTALAFSQAIYEAEAGGSIALRLNARANDPDYYLSPSGGFVYASASETVAGYSRADAPVWDAQEGCWTYAIHLGCFTPGWTAFTATAADVSQLNAACMVIVHSSAPLMLPCEMKTIRNEAFLGTAAEEIVLPEGIVRIGSRAFAGSETLRLVNLPQSLEAIAADAFAGSENVALICAAESEGQRFAQENGIPYIMK